MNEDKRDEREQESWPNEPWQARRGPVTRVVTWVILIGFGLVLLAMVAVLLLGL